MSLRRLVQLVVVWILLAGTALAAQTERWSEQKARDWYERQPKPGKQRAPRPFRNDGSPYIPEEVEFIKRITGKAKPQVKRAA